MVGSAAAVYANDDPVLTACAVARNTDAQIREMMDDFYDSVMDKIVTLLEQDADARADLRRSACPGADIGGGDDHDTDARQHLRRPRRGSSAGRRHRRAAVVERALGWQVAATVSSPPWRRGAAFRGNVVFITGAASGIGRATALKLAADGAELYLTDRDAEGLQTTVADARALGAQVPNTARLTSPTTTRWPPSRPISTPATRQWTW